MLRYLVYLVQRLRIRVWILLSLQCFVREDCIFVLEGVRALPQASM